MNKQNKRQQKMPPQRGVDRYYYPLKEHPTGMAAASMQSLAPNLDGMIVYSDFESITDPNGSYTGKPLDGGRPVQDADDL